MVVNRRSVQRKDSIKIDRESGRNGEPDSIFSIDALRPYFAAMRLDHFLRNPETYARATVVARTRFVDSIKALENVGEILAQQESPTEPQGQWPPNRASVTAPTAEREPDAGRRG